MENRFDFVIAKAKNNHEIEQKVAERDYLDEMRNRFKTGKSTEQIEQEYAAKKEELKAGLEETLHNMVDDFVHSAAEEIVERRIPRSRNVRSEVLRIL